MTTTDAKGQGVGADRLLSFPSQPVFGHGGSQAGYAAILVILPERQTVAVVLVNDENAKPDGWARQLISALDEYVGRRGPSPGWLRASGSPRPANRPEAVFGR
jgi:Beta-lactamase